MVLLYLAPYIHLLFSFSEIITADTAKLSSSLAVLAEIFEELVEIAREDYHFFMLILPEYKLEFNDL